MKKCVAPNCDGASGLESSIYVCMSNFRVSANSILPNCPPPRIPSLKLDEK